MRLKAVIGESELGKYTGTVVRDQESRTKAAEPCQRLPGEPSPWFVAGIEDAQATCQVQ